MTAPKFADGGFIADANGNEQVIFQTTASAVNEIEITNVQLVVLQGMLSALTSTAPIIGASGETNVDLALLPKGGYWSCCNSFNWWFKLTKVRLN